MGADKNSEFTIRKLWINRDGEVVHPNAPVGGGGPGPFGGRTPLGTNHDLDLGILHPWSRAGKFFVMDEWQKAELKKGKKLVDEPPAPTPAPTPAPAGQMSPVFERLYRWLYASEGPVKVMYLDSIHLVTIGIGFMIEPIDSMIGTWRSSLFTDQAGTINASDTDIKTEVAAVKTYPKRCKEAVPGETEPADVPPALRGKVPTSWKDYVFRAKIFMPNRFMKPGVDFMLKGKRRALKSPPWLEFYADFDSFPLDAQVGILSTAYGWFSNNSKEQKAFHNACKAQDWHAAAESGYWNGWLEIKRNGHKLMFENAQIVKDLGLTGRPDPYFPGKLSPSGSYDQADQIRPYGQDIWKTG